MASFSLLHFFIPLLPVIRNRVLSPWLSFSSPPPAPNEKRESVTPSDSPAFPLFDLSPELVCEILKRVREEDRIWLAMTCRLLYNTFTSFPRLLAPRLYTGVRSFATPFPRLKIVLQSKSHLKNIILDNALLCALQQQDFKCAQEIFVNARNDISRDHTFFRQAAKHGNISSLEWLRLKKFRWNDQTISAAVAHGHLHVIQWLRAQDPPCPWSYWCCTVAASSGQLDILEWLRAQEPPCPLDPEICYSVARTEHIHILQWIRIHEPSSFWDRRRILRDLNVSEQIKEWVRSHPD